MQRNRFFLLLIAVTFSCAMRAQQAIGLIPQPREIVATGGTLRLPASFSIGGKQLPDSILAEAKNFAALTTNSRFRRILRALLSISSTRLLRAQKAISSISHSVILRLRQRPQQDFSMLSKPLRSSCHQPSQPVRRWTE